MKRRRVKRSLPRPLDDKDRARIMREAKQWAKSGSFLALRTQAFVALALSGALRTKELLALDLSQVIELGRRRGSFTVRSMGHLQPKQTKGRRRGRHQWDSAGMFVIAKPAREALRAYIAAALEREWFELPPRRGRRQPLFIANKGKNGGHQRINRRTAQYAWDKLQVRAGLRDRRHRYGRRFLYRRTGRLPGDAADPPLC